MTILNLLNKINFNIKYPYYKIGKDTFNNFTFKKVLGVKLFLGENNFYVYKYIFHTYINFYFLNENIESVRLNAYTFSTRFLFKFKKVEFIKYFIIMSNKIKNYFYVYLSTYYNIALNVFKWVWLAVVVVVLYFFISLFYIQLDFIKQIAIWYLAFIAYYLLLSGFNTFLVKYKYGKFTSAIQRFWRRTGTIFWLIEGFLFMIFFYYFLNSSQEPLYMFDYANLNQEFLIQLKISYKNLLLLSICLWLSFFLIININSLIYFQSISIILAISAIITYMLYVESYQFVYIISLFADKEWIFEETQNIWILEIEQNNLRVKQQYFILCLIAKYWHFIFIFISWFFFIIKSIEINSISITMLGYNTQNLLILYILNLFCLVQWVKILIKKFLEITYSWFFIEYDERLFITMLNEFWVVFKSLLNVHVWSNVYVNTVNTLTLYSINENFIWKI